MKSKKDDYVKEIHYQQNEEQLESSVQPLSIDEQIEIYAELIVDQLIKQLNEKQKN
jgi:hypothetical protein